MRTANLDKTIHKFLIYRRLVLRHKFRKWWREGQRKTEKSQVSQKSSRHPVVAIWISRSLQVCLTTIIY